MGLELGILVRCCSSWWLFRELAFARLRIHPWAATQSQGWLRYPVARTDSRCDQGWCDCGLVKLKGRWMDLFLLRGHIYAKHFCKLFAGYPYLFWNASHVKAKPTCSTNTKLLFWSAHGCSCYPREMCTWAHPTTPMAYVLGCNDMMMVILVLLALDWFKARFRGTLYTLMMFYGNKWLIGGFGTFFSICIYIYILGIIIPTDQYFSDGLKPPTRWSKNHGFLYMFL